MTNTTDNKKWDLEESKVKLYNADKSIINRNLLLGFD
jgi:hypothetical protein